MRKIVSIFILIAIVSSCGVENNGELIGVQGRQEWSEVPPHGMVLIPMGSFNMGPSDEDISFAMTSQSKTVSIDPFWMDETEITNNEYRQFVYWVRDSIARRLLLRNSTFPDYAINPDAAEDDFILNWDEDIRWDEEEQVNHLVEQDFFLTKEEQFWNRREVDARKLIFSYFWIDLKQAAKKANRYNFKIKETNPNGGRAQDDGAYEVNGKVGEVVKADGSVEPIKNRSAFIMRGHINVYPDTLVWMSDYTYSYNEPWTKMYFWHPAFDNYPVVGVTWVQANAFCIWRTMLMNDFLTAEGEQNVQDYRLPTEAEWEYAARGGADHSPYPWGGPYVRNYEGCFIANFKPMRGNYVDDGAIRTLAVGSYTSCDHGLYDMSGNVAEWTSNAYNEAAYSFTHDLNPDYKYNAKADDPPALKRKVVRGGSWKDISYYLQTGTRSYEYQDTAKSYIGFRCVRSFMGRYGDEWDGASVGP